MSWSLCRNVDELLHKRHAALLADESMNCLTWATIERANNAGSDQTKYRFLTFGDALASSAHAVVNHSDQHLLLGAMAPPQAKQIVAVLDDQETTIRTMEGPREAATAFADHWSQATGRSHQRQMDQGLYELTSVEMPDAAGGQLVKVAAEHRTVLHALVTGFCDCFPDQPMTPTMIDSRVDRFLREKRAYLWRNSDLTFVSMAAIVRESPNTSSISWVFTPPNHRGQGYAARVVAALSQAQLDAGKKACNLHTDLENDTSNGIYRRIGYTIIGRSFRIRFMEE